MSEQFTEVQIRRFQDADSVSELTDLVRQAYAGLAAMGFRYLATWQDDAITRVRISKGECYVAVCEGALVGTITVSRPQGKGDAEWYSRENVASFQQFGVLPDYQGTGIGRRLLSFAESRAQEFGATELACDTADSATHLIEMYKRHGYREVGTVDWDVTNYKSVILSKKLEPRPPKSDPAIS